MKYLFIRGLINEERYERRKHWMKHAAEWTSRAVAILELTEENIKSVKQATDLEGIGDKAALKLGKIKKDGRFSMQPPEYGKFVSSTSALLVALYLLHQAHKGNDMLNGSLILISEDRLKQVAASLSEEPFLEDVCDGEENHAFCQAWWRLTHLVSRGYVKRRTRNKKPVFELLDEGIDKAQELIETNGLQDVTLADIFQGNLPIQEKEIRSKVQRSSKEGEPPPNLQHLYTNDDGTDGVLLYIDLQEGGGERKGLSDICKKFEREGVRYATRRLVTGDYSWVWAVGGQKVELPLLVERKRADDFAHSMMDGRYQRQKEKMMKWRGKYDSLNIDASLVYIVEGDPASYVVKCGCGCRGVGRCGYPTVQEMQTHIREMCEGSDFRLLTTPDTNSTIDLLITLTKELIHRVENGDFYVIIENATELDKISDNNASKSKPSKAKKRTRPGDNQDTVMAKHQGQRKTVALPKYSKDAPKIAKPNEDWEENKQGIQLGMKTEIDISDSDDDLPVIIFNRQRENSDSTTYHMNSYPSHTAPSTVASGFDSLCDTIVIKDDSPPSRLKEEVKERLSIEPLPSTSYSNMLENEEIPLEIRWEKELLKIREIIFDFDPPIVFSLLEHHNGNVERVIGSLLDEQA